MAEAYLEALAYHLPERVVRNAELQAEQPEWDMARIEAKTGILARHVAAPGETALDLGVAAAERLLAGAGVARESIDVLLFCTQSPDYALPTSACVMQERLGLATRCAALDFNQGCSGYVYGLWLAKGLVAGGLARRVLLVTAETYTKYIHPGDRSVRVLFGDGASASLISADGRGARLGSFALGTDGSGAERLIVPAGGSRRPSCAATAAERTDDNGSVRTDDHLFMDGPELFNFTLRRVPEVVEQVLAAEGTTREDVRWFVLHQANAFMNQHLRMKLRIPKERAPLVLEDVGNTVSSTIPIALHRSAGQFAAGDRMLLVGFGVGFSWGAAALAWGDVQVV